MGYPNMTGHNAPNVPNILRRLMEEQQAQQEQQYIEEQMPDHAGLAPQYAPIDFGQPMQPNPQPQMNALREAVQIPEYAPMPQQMPRTTVEDNSRWKSEPGSDLPMNSFRTESGPNAGVTRSLNFADINPAWGNPQEPQPDYSQPIEIAGVGKGYYEKGGTGNAIINGKRVALGVDPLRVRDNEKWRMAQAKANQDLAMGEVSMAKDRAHIDQMRAPKHEAAPSGFRFSADGRNLEFIPGGPADPVNSKKDNPSEDERRSAGLAVRMEGAIKEMEKFPDAMKPEVTAETLRGIPMVPEAAANWATSKERQQVEGAQLDALDAALTLATGAAYTKDQLKNLSKSYFPQLNDDADTVASKKERLQKVIETARIRAGRAAGDISRVSGGARAPQVGEVRKGYRFKGGDPASQASWERA